MLLPVEETHGVGLGHTLNRHVTFGGAQNISLHVRKKLGYRCWLEHGRLPDPFRLQGARTSSWQCMRHCERGTTFLVLLVVGASPSPTRGKVRAENGLAYAKTGEELRGGSGISPPHWKMDPTPCAPRPTSYICQQAAWKTLRVPFVPSPLAS